MQHVEKVFAFQHPIIGQVCTMDGIADLVYAVPEKREGYKRREEGIREERRGYKRR